MKVELIGKKHTGGFATLEILLAFAIFTLCISAVIMVAFGNQSVAIDGETNNEAIWKAQTLLEKARANSRQDFNLVNPSTTTETTPPYYIDKLDVATSATDPTLDLWTKRVTSTVVWQTGGRTLSIALATLLTNPPAINDENTCSSVLTGDWKNPQIENTINFSSLPHIPAGTYILTDIDAYKNKLYVTAGKTSNITDPTLFVFDINNTSDPKLIGQIDNDIKVKTGLSAIVVAGKYAFAASASSYARGQMQVIDLDSTSVVKTFKVPVIDPLGSSNGSGNSIFYKNGIIYLGLTKSTSENEFNIVDVSEALNPVYKGGYPIGNAINAIMVRNDYAYIASPNDQELQILDISNLNNPESKGGFNSPTGGGNGKSLYLVGDKLYLGKTNGAGFDLHILDNTNPAGTLAQLGGIDIGSGNSIDGIIVRDYLSFLLTNKDLEIFNTNDPLHITPWSTYPLPGTYNSSYTEPSMDCEGNRIFISSNNEGGQGSIYIIKPGT